jgi:lambda family phage portal protein
MTDPDPDLRDQPLAYTPEPVHGIVQIDSRHRGGYQGASRTRDALAGWRTTTYSPDVIASLDLPTLRERCADLGRNNPTAAGALNTQTEGVVGTGLRLNASVDRDYLGISAAVAEKFEDDMERLWNIWSASKDCHVKREYSFDEQLEIIFRSVAIAGDHFVQLTRAQDSSLPFLLAIQHIAAERVSNPNDGMDTPTMIQGIEKTPYGAPKNIHVLNVHPGDTTSRLKREWTTVPIFNTGTGRRNVLHVKYVQSDSHTRGIPIFAPVIEPLKQSGRYVDAEVDSVVKNAMWALIVHTDSGGGISGLLSTASLQDRIDYYAENPVNAIAEGSRVAGLFPGDQLTSFNPSRPNDSFDPFMKAMARQIAPAIGMPPETLQKEFLSSYSAARAALLLAHKYYDGRRKWLADNICKPVYGAFADEMVATGRVFAPGYFADPLVREAYLGSEWYGDAHGEIDEGKAVAAATARIDAGLSTKKREATMITGQDWMKIARQRKREMAEEPEGD